MPEMRDHCATCEELVEFDEAARIGERLVCRECVAKVCLQASKVLKRRRVADAIGMAVVFDRLDRPGEAA